MKFGVLTSNEEYKLEGTKDNGLKRISEFIR
jgi:hypothetical protein